MSKCENCRRDHERDAENRVLDGVDRIGKLHGRLLKKYGDEMEGEDFVDAIAVYMVTFAEIQPDPDGALADFVEQITRMRELSRKRSKAK